MVFSNEKNSFVSRVIFYVVSISYDKTYLYLGSSKWIQEYHEVFLKDFTSGSIEDMRLHKETSGKS